MDLPMRRCSCGAEPRLAVKNITGVDLSCAVYCSALCGDDSHWQMSMTAAVTRWNAGLVRGASGGNGAASDDTKTFN